MYVSKQFIVCLEIFNNKQAAEFRSHFSLATSVVYSIILFIPRSSERKTAQKRKPRKKWQNPVRQGTGGSIFGLRYCPLLIRCC